MMKRFLFCATLLLASASAFAGKVVTEVLPSSVLGADVSYNVYLPDGFDASAATGKTYPVIYLLHGLSDDYSAWVLKGGMQTVVDELIECGEAGEAVIVMPNAGGSDVHHIWNGYFNMPGWSYEDFFFSEFLPFVEKKFRAGGDKEHRAIMGLSMGGGGSVVYCQRHPEMFSSCFAMSPWLDNQTDEVETSKAAKDCLYYVGEAVKKYSALAFLDNADEATLERLRTVSWFVDCGDDDFILDLSLAFHQKMRDHGVKSELRVRNGIHNWEYWHISLRQALPFASRNFGK